MGNEIRVFNSEEFGKVRGIEINGEPWLVGKDVAEILGYDRGTKSVVDHVDAEDRKYIGSETQSQLGIELGQRGGWLVNESGLYSLVWCSKLPKAKQFRRWVTSVVLPSIRKTGGYISGQEEMSDADLIAKALMVAARQLEERERRIADQQNDIKLLTERNEIMQPKADYYDALCSKDGTTNLRNTAKEFDIPERQFVQMLIDKKILYRDQNNIVVPYAKYAHNGWFKLRDKSTDRYLSYQTRITIEGKDAIRKMLMRCDETRRI